MASDQMASLENKFKVELYKKYEKCSKVLIPKEKYIETIEAVKTAAAKGASRLNKLNA
jgi:hypothetical protein